MNYETVESALGVIVFGPGTDTLEGIQWTASKLRQAAALLEYRYAIERRYDAGGYDRGEGLPASPIAGPGTADDSQPGQLAPAKRKRKHRATTPRANGAAHQEPPPAPSGNPLFPPEGATE